MLWDIPHLIAELSRFFILKQGDVILTGTPAGVAKLARGDRLHGHVAGVGDLEVAVV